MPTYKAPVEDVQFLLNDVFHMERYGNMPGFADATPDTLAAVLEEAAKLAEEVVQPLNRVGDLEGCKRRDDGSVTTPTGFKDAYKLYAEGGWMGVSVPPEYGGQGRPGTYTVMINELLGGANIAFSMYPGLTQGAIAALLHHGSDQIKTKYLPNMTSGKWTGTMNLTEPHCGTDLGLSRAKAVLQATAATDFRHQDRHLVGEQISRKNQHLCSRARRLARRKQGPHARHRADVHGEGRRLAWEAATA